MRRTFTLRELFEGKTSFELMFAKQNGLVFEKIVYKRGGAQTEILH